MAFGSFKCLLKEYKLGLIFVEFSLHSIGKKADCFLLSGSQLHVFVCPLGKIDQSFLHQNQSSSDKLLVNERQPYFQI